MKPCRVVAAALTLALAAAGCASSELVAPESPAVYVGRVEGTDAVVAAVAGEGRVVLYVCGGASSYGGLTRWLSAEAVLAEGAAPLALESRGVRVSVALAGGVLRGRVEDGAGTSHGFAARPRVEGTLAGLYGVMDEGCRTGVVVEQAAPGGPASVQGTWCSANGELEQVTPILPVQLAAGVLPVQVSRPAGLRTLMAAPVLPVRP